MHKGIESVVVVLFAVGFYIGLPALMVWGWVRWLKRTQPRIREVKRHDVMNDGAIATPHNWRRKTRKD